MKDIYDILSGVPSFNGLSKDQLEEIKQIVIDRHFKKGELIFSEGDNGNGFYVVVSGLVKIFKVSLKGKEHTIHILGPGEPFGQVAVYAGKTFPANAQAIADSHLLFLSRTKFITLITRNPSLALNMLSVLSIRLRDFTVHVENIVLKDVPGRLSVYLLLLADEQKNVNDIVSLSVSKSQLSSILGTTPETLSRILTKMADKGLIEVNKRDIRILKRKILEDLAEHGGLISD